MLSKKGLFGLVMGLFLCLVTLVLAQGPRAGTPANPQTVLVANLLNGNNEIFFSQINLFNASDSPGAVTVRVFTLPAPFAAAQELTFLPLQLGTLGAESAVSIQLDTDILAHLGGVGLPYTNDGGGLVARFEIGAEHVSGVVLIRWNFPVPIATTYPLQVVDD